MKKGRLLLAVALLAVTSAFLVAGTLPIAATGGVADAGDGNGTVIRVGGHYAKGLN